MDDYVLDARVEHVRNFVHILTAVKLSRKQHARVSVGERGLTIVSLDDSKSLQAQANFRAEVFRAYDVNLAAASHHHHAGTRRAGVSSHAATFALALGPLIDVPARELLGRGVGEGADAGNGDEYRDLWTRVSHDIGAHTLEANPTRRRAPAFHQGPREVDPDQ